MAKRKLTKQQLTRIKKTQDDHLSKNNKTQTSQNDETEGKNFPGTIVSHYGKALDVEDTDGHIIQCTARQNLGNLVCGDRILWRKESDTSGVITALEPRQSLLTRSDFHGKIKAVAANIDQVIIVCTHKPLLRESLIDKYLVAIENLGLLARIVFNKTDLLSTHELTEIKHRLSVYSDIGYKISYISAKQDSSIDQLNVVLSKHTSILAGQSGVGKSTIIKLLLPDEDIVIGKLSDAKDKGKHTTTVSRLYHLSGGGNIIDSPGVRDFGIGDINHYEILQGFVEIRPYIGMCKFKNCAHINEPDCAIKEALNAGKINPRRMQSFLQMIA